MPMASDPNATTEYWLAIDKDKPIESRPVFLVKFMTVREHERVETLIQKAFEAPGTKQGNIDCYKLLCEAIAVGVVGWRNMTDAEGKAVAFEATGAKLEEAVARVRLTQREIWELVRGYPRSVSLAADDFFLSVSPAASAGAASAPAAAPTASATGKGRTRA